MWRVSSGGLSSAPTPTRSSSSRRLTYGPPPPPPPPSPSLTSPCSHRWTPPPTLCCAMSGVAPLLAAPLTSNSGVRILNIFCMPRDGYVGSLSMLMRAFELTHRSPCRWRSPSSSRKTRDPTRRLRRRTTHLMPMPVRTPHLLLLPPPPPSSSSRLLRVHGT